MKPRQALQKVPRRSADTAENGQRLPAVRDVVGRQLRQGLEGRFAGQFTERERQLEAHARGRIIGEGEQRRTQRRQPVVRAFRWIPRGGGAARLGPGPVEAERFAEPHRVLAHARMGVLQGHHQQPLFEGAEAVQDVQRVQTAIMGGGIARQSFERRNRRAVLFFDQETMGGIAPPAVVVGQVLHQFGHFRRGEPGPGVASLEVLRRDPPEAPVGFAFAPVDFVNQLGGDPVRVLDNLAVKIDDVKRAIGPVGEKDRMKPAIGGGEELTIGLAGKTAGNKLRAVRVEPAAGDEVLRRLATEGIAGVDKPAHCRRGARYWARCPATAGSARG